MYEWKEYANRCGHNLGSADSLRKLNAGKSWFHFTPSEARRAQKYRAVNAQHAQSYWLMCALSFLAAHIDHSILISAYRNPVSKLRALGRTLKSTPPPPPIYSIWHPPIAERKKNDIGSFPWEAREVWESGSPVLLLEWQQGPADGPMVWSTTGQFLLCMLLGETKPALTYPLLTFLRTTAAGELCQGKCYLACPGL